MWNQRACRVINLGNFWTYLGDFWTSTLPQYGKTAVVLKTEAIWSQTGLRLAKEISSSKRRWVRLELALRKAPSDRIMMVVCICPCPLALYLLRLLSGACLASLPQQLWRPNHSWAVEKEVDEKDIPAIRAMILPVPMACAAQVCLFVTAGADRNST